MFPLYETIQVIMMANYATEELYTQMHTLETRDLSIENATSFIIIISIGFVAFTLLCAATSIYYRRRMLLAYQGDLQPEWATPLGPGESGDKPQLWDVPVSKSKKVTTRTNGYGRFATVFVSLHVPKYEMRNSCRFT